tara:strand:+ start:2041 stop:2199 length:159 start_codon:yes stop_codon:yes gene_type:complete
MGKTVDKIHDAIDKVYSENKVAKVKSKDELTKTNYLSKDEKSARKFWGTHFD